MASVWLPWRLSPLYFFVTTVDRLFTPFLSPLSMCFDTVVLVLLSNQKNLVSELLLSV